MEFWFGAWGKLESIRVKSEDTYVFYAIVKNSGFLWGVPELGAGIGRREYGENTCLALCVG